MTRILVQRPDTIDLAPGRHLLYFKFDITDPEWMRVLSDRVNLEATMLNEYGFEMQSWKLNGTTVQPSTKTFIADVTVYGTPLVLLLTPLIQAVFILTAGYVLLQFLESRPVVALGKGIEDVGGGIKGVGDAVKDLAGKLGDAAKDLTGGAGKGLQYGLPIAAAGVGAVALLVLLGGFGKVRVGR